MIGVGETKTRMRTNVIWRQCWKWCSTVFVISHTFSSALLYNFNVAQSLFITEHFALKSLVRTLSPVSLAPSLGSPRCVLTAARRPCAPTARQVFHRKPYITVVIFSAYWAQRTSHKSNKFSANFCFVLSGTGQATKRDEVSEKLQNVQHKFLDWNPPTPFGSFPKVHLFW